MMPSIMALLEFLETFTSMFSTLDALSKKKSQRLCVNQETKRPYLKLAQNVEDVIRKEDVMEIFEILSEKKGLLIYSIFI